MAVRSKLLGLRASSSTGSPQHIYTCPADRTAIVKFVSVHNGTNVAGAVRLAVRRAGVDVSIWRQPGVAAATIVTLTGWDLVLEPDDQLLAFIDAAFGQNAVVQFAVAGAELDGVAPPP